MFDEFNVIDEMDKMNFLKATRIVYYFSITVEVLMILLLLPQSFLTPEGFVDSKIVYISLIGLMGSQRLLLTVTRSYYQYQSGDLKQKRNLIINILLVMILLCILFFAIWKITNWNSAIM